MLARFARCLMVLLVVAAAQWPTLAFSQAKRIALVIGNKGYATPVGPLRNPHNDITLVADALRAAGFEVLEPVREATRARLLQAVRLFALRLQAAGPDAVGFLYYSGHGAAIGSQNYLIPVDVEKPDSASLSDGGVPQREIIDRLAEIAPNAVHYLVIDACRNNLGGTKGPKGFLPENRRDGMLIAFAASPDKPASDEGDKSGPYAAALAAELNSPERDDYLLFHRVRVAVDRATRGEQVPWIEDGMRREERVKLGTSALKELPAPTTATTFSRAEVAAFCREIATNPSAAIVSSLREAYKGTPMAGCAEVRLAELKRQAVAAGAPAPPPAARPEPATPRCDGVEVALGTGGTGTGGTACVKPGSGQSFKDCPTCPEMVVVPAGSFMMGSPESEPGRGSDEGPQRRVTIAKPFAVGKFEVTFAEWDACVKAGQCGDEGWGNGRRPAINMSWYDAKQYVAWLSKTTRESYRLLSEAEWEYAARAGTTTSYSWGDDFDASLANSNKGETVAVGEYAANHFGLHDMHGNVWEWVEDCWNDDYRGATSDGTAQTSGECGRRVLRGGSWGDNPLNLRSAYRYRLASDYRFLSLGIRVGRSL